MNSLNFSSFCSSKNFRIQETRIKLILQGESCANPAHLSLYRRKEINHLSASTSSSPTKPWCLNETCFCLAFPDLPRLPCGYCGKTYKRIQHLRRHQRFECGQGRQFKCSFCAYSSKRMDNLKTHAILNHSTGI